MDLMPQHLTCSSIWLREIVLYLGDLDLIEAIEHWSMAGSLKAIKQIKSKCSQISVARPELLFEGAPRICVVWGKTRS